MTTFASFVSSMSGLEISGVQRSYTYAPESLGAADLPAQFVRLPEGDLTYAPDNCQAIGKTRTIDLIVCLEPANLETASRNYDDTVAMMDYIETALDAWNAAQGAVMFSYSISTSGTAPVYVGSTPYWAVIASINGVN